jgi:hypothetical protein
MKWWGMAAIDYVVGWVVIAIMQGVWHTSAINHVPGYMDGIMIVLAVIFVWCIVTGIVEVIKEYRRG